jgi:ribosomal protein S21
VGGVRTVTKGVGIFVGNDGDVDRAMRKLKRTMIGEGIIREQKKRRVGDRFASRGVKEDQTEKSSPPLLLHSSQPPR